MIITIYIYRYIGCLHGIEIRVFKLYAYLIGETIGKTIFSNTFA